MRRDLALITVAKLVVSAFVLLLGFRAVSDDDYARVVIAQAFAREPRVDPSGTSWLPAPFWVLGAAMQLFGRSLLVAQVLAVVCGVVSMWLVYLAARWITGDRTSALFGALLACATTWSAMLGVSTVPELPTAALTLFALASMTGARTPARALAGGVALLLACLSRYEPWFIAIPFVAFALRDSIDPARTRRDRALLLLAAALSTTGPLTWILWNRYAHGAPLAFLSSVAGYHDAVSSASLPRRVVTYAYALLRAEPELLALTALLVFGALSSDVRRAARARFARPALALMFVFVALTAAMVRGGAPTHHPERALVAVFLLVAVVAGSALREGLRGARPIGARRAAVALVGVAVLAWPVRRFVLRSEVLADRATEVDIGARAAAILPAGARAHVDVVDYGYFAIQAATGRPEAFVPNTGAGLEGALGVPTPAVDGYQEALASGLRFAIVRASSAPLDASPLAKNEAWVLLELR